MLLICPHVHVVIINELKFNLFSRFSLRDFRTNKLVNHTRLQLCRLLRSAIVWRLGAE